MGDNTKLSEAALKKLLGTRTPLPGNGKQQSPEFMIPAPAAAASAPRDRSGIAALPANPAMNPGAITRAQEDAAEQGMKCGGKVKRMASGGKVRGCGMASKGHTKGKMR